MAQIGITLADHSFYPVLEDETPQRKRLVLTSARSGQESVQVDILRRGDGADQLVGCLVLEELPGDPGAELELVLGLDGEGNIDARISDSSGALYQSLSVNLSQLEVDSVYAHPEPEEEIGVDASGGVVLSDFSGELDGHVVQDERDEGDEEDEERRSRRRRFNPVLLVAVVLIVLGITLVGAYFVFMLIKGDPLPELRALISSFSSGGLIPLFG